MRRLLVLSALFAVAGCGRPPVTQQLDDFKNQIFLHMSNLNNDAEVSRIDARGTRPRADVNPSIGRQFSTYTFYPDGVLLYDIECPGCRTKHMVLAYRGEPMLCPSCGSRGKEGKQDRPLITGGQTKDTLVGMYEGRVKPMFEVLKDAGKDKLAIVRYIRRQWVLDAGAKLEPRAMKQEHASYGILTDPKNFQGGLHRLDATFVATTAFVYDGTIAQLDPVSVSKLAKGDADRKTWRLGGSAALEEPLRPWNNPATLNTPNLRNYPSK